MAAEAIRLQKGGGFHCPLPRWWSRAFLAAVLSLFFALFQSPAAEAVGPWAPVIGAATGPGGALYVLTSEKGGLFVSGDGGRRWKNLGAGLPSSLLFSLDVSPEGRLFLASFDELLTSADGGSAWKSLKGGGGVNRFFPTSGNTLLAVFWDSGIHWASSSGDASFEKSGGEDGSFPVLDLLDEGHGRLRAAAFGRGVLFSGDGGRTWSPDDPGIENVFPLALARSSATGTVFAGTLEGGAFRKEEGSPWVPASEGLPSFCTVQALAADEKGVLWAGTHKQGLFLSFDDGRTWNPFPAGTEKDLSVTVLVPFRKKILAGTSSGELFLADGEKGAVTELLPSDPVVGLAGVDGRLLCLSRSGEVSVSSDGGARWTSRGRSAGGKALFLTAVPGGRLFAGTEKDLLFSRDGGLAWTSIPLPEGTVFTSLAGTAGGELFAGTAGSGLYRSSDGWSWQKVDEVQGARVHSLRSSDGTVIAAGTDAGFSVSLDGGLSWKNEEVIYGILSLAFDGQGRLWGASRTGLWNFPLPEGEITEAQAAGFDWSPLEYFTDLFPGEGNGLIALLGERAVRLLPGEAPGSFSLRETNLSNVRVLCSLRDTGGALLLGTERGLFRSTDGGATWSEIALP